MAPSEMDSSQSCPIYSSFPPFGREIGEISSTWSTKTLDSSYRIGRSQTLLTLWFFNGRSETTDLPSTTGFSYSPQIITSFHSKSVLKKSWFSGDTSRWSRFWTLAESWLTNRKALIKGRPWNLQNNPGRFPSIAFKEWLLGVALAICFPF